MLLIRQILICFFILPVVLVSAQASPVMHVVDFSNIEYTQVNKNGDLEQTLKTRFVGVQPYQSGYQIAAGEGIDQSTAAVCDNPGNLGMGLSWSITLSQKAPEPIRFTGWSRAEGVEGSPSSNYSLYIDIVYMDGTPSWGHQVHFDTGSHDWQQKSLIILPEKAVQSIACYALFRNSKGKVWFDNLSVQVSTMPEGMIRFDALSAQLVSAVSIPVDGTTLQTKDGLNLRIDPLNGAASAISVNKKNLPLASTLNGFLVRDVGQSSDYYPFYQGTCESLQCTLKLDFKVTDHAVHILGTLQDETKTPRALNLVYAIPVDAIGWKWGEDIRNSQSISDQEEYSSWITIGTGSNGKLSHYPFACVASSDSGLALGVDLGKPLQYRLGYSGGSRSLYCSMDIGLHPETRNFPSQAHFEIVIYGIDSAWGFRSAAEQYYQIFPDYFAVRSKDQGIWMPFTDVSTVQGWQDFGFKYHEGNNNVGFDDLNNILSFRYSEPSTWWMAMPVEVPRTYGDAMKMVEDTANSSSSNTRAKAQALLSSGSYDSNAHYQLQFRNEPWCNGAVFSLNPSPYLEGKVTHASMMWSDDIANRLYGASASHILDGEYLDSLEAYVTADLNFREDHFKKVTFPLTFTLDTRRPVIHKAFSQYEFTRYMGEQMHQRGKLLFANSVPNRFGFLCPWLDVMGTETNWIQNGKFAPNDDSIMNFRRTLCGQKPYLFLMNTNFDYMTFDIVEQYFQRCLFYGMFPSMFSHNAAEDPYWRNQTLYNRDRPLFVRYQPIIKTIAEAGWEPVTCVKTNQDSIWVERYGNSPRGPIYITVLNSSNKDLSYTLTGMGVLGHQAKWKNMLSDQTGAWAQGMEGTIPAQNVQAFKITDIEIESSIRNSAIEQ